MLSRQGIGVEQLGVAALKDDLSAVVAGMRAEIHDMVTNFDNIRVMLHHQDSIAFVAQFLQQLVQYGAHRADASQRWVHRKCR